MKLEDITTLGELKNSDYKSKSIKEELRQNLLKKIRNSEATFEGIHGYEATVIPELERAILSRHNINLLGLRGQAKTRLARLMVNLLDEWMPIVEGSEINDDPFNPISRFAREILKEKGEETPIVWVHREERFFEKLATPDVTVADLIGDVDPIKAANLKLSYADDRVTIVESEAEVPEVHLKLSPREARVRAVEALEPGWYHYDGLAHALEPIGVTWGPAEMTAAAGDQDWVGRAPLVLAYTGVLERTRWRYDTSRAYRVVQMDVGHLSQTAYLVATAMGFGIGFTAALRDELVEHALGCDAYHEVVLGLSALGPLPE